MTNKGKSGPRGSQGAGDVSPQISALIAFDLCRGVIRQMICAHFDDDSCIASTGLAVDVLRDLGVEVEAVPCHLIIANEAYAAWAAGSQRFVPLNDEEAQAAARAGGRLIVMAGPTPPGQQAKTVASLLCADSEQDEDRYPGHVVAIAKVDGTSFLIDLSIDQARRPADNIDPSPFVLPIRAPFVDEGDSVVIRNGKASLLYERSRDLSFKESPNFSRIADDEPSATIAMAELRLAVTLFVTSVYRKLVEGMGARGAPPSIVTVTEIDPEIDPEPRLGETMRKYANLIAAETA